MTSYSALLVGGASLPPSPDNALVTGAGTASRPLGDKLAEIISPADWGAVGDGATNNSTALIAMRDYCEANFQSTGVEIRFPPGHYQYTANTWLPNCRHVVVRGPAKLQCTNGTAGQTVPLSSGDMFMARRADLSGNIPAAHTGYLIEDATSQAGTVTLVTAGEAAQFSVGMPVFIHGFNQQEGGYPYNLRYFEWHDVASIAGRVLTLRARLQHNYSRTNWADFGSGTTGYGKPRIVPLVRSNYYYPNYILFEDLEWLENPNWGGINGNAFQPIARHTVVKRVSMPGEYWPAMTETAYVSDSYINKPNDLDKLVDTLTFERCFCDFDLATATGINNVVVRDCTINGIVRLGSRRWEVTGCKVIANSEFGAIAGREATPSSYVRIVNNDFFGSNNNNYLFNNTVGTVPAAATSAGSFKVANTSGNRIALNRWGIGHQIWNANYAKVSTIRDITWDGTDHVVHHGADVTFTEAESISCNIIKNVYAAQNRYYKAGILVDQEHYTFRNGGPLFEELDGRKVFRGRPFITGTPQTIPLPFAGRAQKLTVMCRAPHATAVRWDMTAKDNTGVAVALFEGSLPAAGDFVIVDLIAGTTTFVGAWASTSGLATPWAGRFYDISFRIRLANATNPTYTSFADTPAFEVILDGVTGLGG